MEQGYASGGEERRKSPRYQDVLQVQVSTGQHCHDGVTNNVSFSGIFVSFPDVTVRTFSPSQRIDIKFAMPGGEMCRLTGRVARVVADAPSASRKGIGVEIVGGESGHLSRYAEFIRKH